MTPPKHASEAGRMNLFKMEVHTKRKRLVLDVIAIADDIEAAKAHVAARYPKCELRNAIEIHLAGPKHFVVGEWVTD